MVTVEEVTNAIKKVDVNKACGSDGICSEYIKYADRHLYPCYLCASLLFCSRISARVNVVSCTCASD